MSNSPTIPGRQVAEILTAILLILWRVYDRAADAVWTDWTILLCLYWIASIAVGKRKQAAAVHVVFVVALMAVYLWGQAAQAIAPLGLGR